MFRNGKKVVLNDVPMRTIAIYDDYFEFGVQPSGSYSFVQDLRRAKLESLRVQQQQQLEQQEAQLIEQAQREVRVCVWCDRRLSVWR